MAKTTKVEKVEEVIDDAAPVVPEVETKKEEKILNPDKFMDLIKIIQGAKEINDLKPTLYKHILEIAKRNGISDAYHLLFLYEPNSSIEQGMVDKIYNAIPDGNIKPILLLIHNHGGRIEPAYLISKTCKELSPKFVVTIPRKAKSAATLISLGGNEIHMGPMSELGPIDPQFAGLPALGISSSLESIAKIVCKYPESSPMFADFMKEKLDLRILGYFERVSESAQQYAIRLLAGKELKLTADEVAHKLVYEYKDHSFVIDKEEAKDLLGDIVKVNTNEYKFGNEIHKFLNEVNIIIGIFKSKSLAIVGSPRDFIITDKKKDEE
ncbi:SDH family Clp fold serine proteinase [Flavobacterium sp. MAHUQ-51]|uniref:SDH family Clp fold serine proteinase n=1 Tax=Flavobacterium sp. GCM10022190 TaxID=3252639 RepID=UPI00360F107E